MADEKFKVGNWRDLAYKFNIRTSESLTAKEGFLQKNELISGLIGHSYIRELYSIDQMEVEARVLEE